MANSGFSAAVEYFGTITGLTAKESSDGKNGNVAEAANAFGDTVATDTYGQLIHPSVTYAVTASASTFPALGSIVTRDSTKIMVTSIAFNTSAGQPPTVTISGEEVHSTATAVRTYGVTATILPRCKAQDVAGLFTAQTGTIASPNDWASINTTFSVDFVNQTVAGNIVAACATHGRIEAQATLTSANGAGTIELSSAASTAGAILSAPAATSDPDAAYEQITATATEYLVGIEATNGGSSV